MWRGQRGNAVLAETHLGFERHDFESQPIGKLKST
jgi:hypothetical protein